MDKIATRKRRTLRSEIIKTVFSILILGLGVAIFFKMLWMWEPPPNKKSSVLVPLVSVVPAKPYMGKIDLVVSGLVQPAHEINMTSEINGIVKVKHDACEAGAYVQEGTLLLEIDPKDFNATMDTNKADLEQATKRVEEAEVEIAGAERNIQFALREMAIAEADHQRNLRLLAKGVISKAEADQTDRTYVAAKSQLTARENAKAAAEARLESAIATKAISQTRIDQSQLTMDKLTISSSKTGVVVQEFVQEGDAIRVGSPLLTFEVTDKVEVLTTLMPSELAWLRENTTLDASEMNPEQKIAAAYAIPKVNVDIFENIEPDLVWDGVLESFDGIGRDDRTKTIPCRIVVRQPVVQTGSRPRALLRNTFVKCRFVVDIEKSDSADTPLVFPATAVTPGEYVWIAKSKRLDRKKVEVLDEIIDEKTGEAMVVVRAGKDSIQIDDLVVVSPLNQPTVGAEARIQNISELDPDSVDSDSKKESDQKAEVVKESDSGMLNESG